MTDLGSHGLFFLSSSKKPAHVRRKMKKNPGDADHVPIPSHEARQPFVSAHPTSKSKGKSKMHMRRGSVMHATDLPTVGRSITAVRHAPPSLPLSIPLSGCVRYSASGPARPYLFAAHATTTPTHTSFLPNSHSYGQADTQQPGAHLARGAPPPIRPPPPPLTRPPWRKPRLWRPGMGLSQLLLRFLVIRKRYKIGITSSCRKP
ncbi:hypothetical protein VPH35_101296 [Triticum aestivum]